jgi:DNA replication protein DnaC
MSKLQLDDLHGRAHILRLPHLKSIITKNELSNDVLKFLDEYTQGELLLRHSNAIKSRIRLAEFNQIKIIQDLELSYLPDVLVQKLPELKTLKFIEDSTNLILMGSPGTGKTHVSIALGMLACQRMLKVKFCHVPTLIAKLKQSNSERRLTAFINTFLNYDLIILDELGYISLDKEGAELLFQLLDARSEKKSTIITTNMDFSEWGKIFNDEKMAGAIIDRMCYKSVIVKMNKKSYRLSKTQEMNQII